MTVRYASEIKRVFPSGPYYLGGYCLGGTIALEIAQRLVKGGDAIGLLFMIENYNVKTIDWPEPLHIRLANKMLNVRYHAENLLSRGNTAKKVFFKTKFFVELARWKISCQLLLSSFQKKIGMQNRLDFPHVNVAKLYDNALMQYTPGEFPGKMVLFGSRKRLAGLTDKLYGWDGIPTHGIEYHELPIRPRASLTEPYVRILAKKIRTCLDHAGQVDDVRNIDYEKVKAPANSSLRRRYSNGNHLSFIPDSDHPLAAVHTVNEMIVSEKRAG